MQELPFTLVEVFNDKDLNFRGNTAAVVLIPDVWDVDTMRRLAADFNQPATTFLWKTEEDNQYGVRWFAPDEEIGLCGHGSMAAVAFLAHTLALKEPVKLLFNDGTMMVKYRGDEAGTISLKGIPVLSEEKVPELLTRALGIPLKGYFTTGNKQIALAYNEQDIKNMKPDFSMLRQSETFGYAVTAPGEKVDFVSRTLVPHVQQLEDHATGSSHAALVPFWAKRLGKSKMIAYQLSPRGGKFICEDHHGDVVSLTGNFRIIANGYLVP